jgi:hypothetical protein
MAKTIRHLVLCVMMTGRAAADSPVAAANMDEAVPARVRSTNPAITAVIARAHLQSQTFRELVTTIDNSDGIVYVEEGECGLGVRACLANVTAAGAHRMLWVVVDTDQDDWDLMGSIGHELRHTIEVLGDPSVTSNAAMFMLYSRIGWRGMGRAFETHEAVEAGTLVRAEVLKSRLGTAVE